MDISTNAKDFSTALMKMMDHVDGSIEQVIRKACIDLYKSIAEKTPVDTGRAKASWSVGNMNYGDEKPYDKDGFSFNEVQGAIDSNVSGFQVELLGDQVVIYNNLDYIEQLESGTSTQAPSGMVAISLAEFTVHFNKALKGFDL